MARIMTEEQENDIERLPSAWKPLVRKTLERNIKMTTEDILGIWELPQPWDVQGNMVDIAWLKTGNVKSGLKHGWKMEGSALGIKGTGRPILAFYYNDTLLVAAVTVATNGYIVRPNLGSSTDVEYAGLHEDLRARLTRECHSPAPYNSSAALH
ncbi:hypothetical protein V8E54_000071 [Elaphomyces granulatus]